MRRSNVGSQHIVIAIVGPTASGKSEVAQAVAQRLNGVVLSADSMQVYCGMDIGTGKVTPGEMRVEHFGLDLVEPGEPFSAALYQQYGRGVLERMARSNIPVVVCGGTGFYIRALLDRFDFPAGEQVGNPVRDACNARLEQVGAHALWEELRQVDPASAALIHENDSKRVVRAFELLADNTTYAAQKEAFAHIPQAYPAAFFGLKVEPAVLNARIDQRVDAMVRDGLVNEVQGLLDRGLRRGLTAPQAIGYKEIVAYLDGEWPLNQAVDAIKVATHRYAKRQRTWFRKDDRIHWLDANDYDANRLAEQVLFEAGLGENEERSTPRL